MLHLTLRTEFISGRVCLTMADNNTECKLYPGENEKCLTLKYVTVTSSIISALGAVMALIVIVYFRLFKDFTQKMVINLCIASLFLAISYLTSQFEDDVTTFCVFQGAAVTFSIWACLLWTMCILANMYTRVIFEYKWKHKEKVASFVCWFLPALMATLPFIGEEVYAPTEIWCWIKNDSGWRFGIWYTWHMLSVFIFIFAIIHIIWKLRKRQHRHSTNDPREIDSLNEDIRTMSKYPVVYTLVSIVAIVCRITNITRGSSFPMLILLGLTLPLLGSAVAFVFVIDKRTLKLLNRKEIRKAFQKWTSEEATVQVYSVTDSNVNEAPVEPVSQAPEIAKNI
ncbi:hypothetical protein ACF0H5_013843 [Mactra antiquata]